MVCVWLCDSFLLLFVIWFDLIPSRQKQEEKYARTFSITQPPIVYIYIYILIDSVNSFSAYMSEAGFFWSLLFSSFLLFSFLFFVGFLPPFFYCYLTVHFIALN